MSLADRFPDMPDLPDFLGWDSQVVQYDRFGKPGFAWEQHHVEEVPVECLLFRDDNGRCLGILNYFPEGGFSERPGNFLIQVDPAARRKGIGTSLLVECEKRFRLNLDQQVYTVSGLALVVAYEGRRACACGHMASKHLHNVGPCLNGGAMWTCPLGCMEFHP